MYVIQNEVGVESLFLILVYSMMTINMIAQRLFQFANCEKEKKKRDKNALDFKIPFYML